MAGEDECLSLFDWNCFVREAVVVMIALPQ